MYLKVFFRYVMCCLSQPVRCTWDINVSAEPIVANLISRPAHCVVKSKNKAYIHICSANALNLCFPKMKLYISILWIPYDSSLLKLFFVKLKYFPRFSGSHRDYWQYVTENISWIFLKPANHRSNYKVASNKKLRPINSFALRAWCYRKSNLI